MSGEVVLALEDVRHAFGDVAVLDGVSLDVKAGSVTCLLGPNGSGKSTLLSIAAGLRTPDDGAVTRRTAGAARSVGYLPQRPAFRPQFTVAETIAFYGSLVPMEIDETATLGQVGLDGVADRQVENLSGGMVRLLGLAQATVGSPPIVVLDEPASGLDPQLRHHIADVIADLAANGAAVLMATHDLGAAERIADEVRVLDDGAFVAGGSPAAIEAETGTDLLEGAIDALIDREDAIGVRSGTAGDRG
ncbi:Nod factor export ATP-binding protein I [Halorhabdus tiamatea SARL4B]|uniref:ABC transporter, ATP-binding protein (Probable substrate copper) n=1 Tax=Halorhabdus tiamatea SARL4B TaxID=1033806 RepID=F7PPW2_9EURY|nr:ABC transporter ATP-binding protein [Halorhabdus tiamatea]ERJ05003.1 Nod factor export ATP-binding protein I [Halorhabdus tiamatea SARL4B]CCQ32428.1 ABC transporter, ATP-binding protein (probable substrate copper) [Halorhabdus tiamatea SARL4B]